MKQEKNKNLLSKKSRDFSGKHEKYCENNSVLSSFVGLSASLMGIFMVSAFGVLIFAPSFSGELVAIAWAFTTLGAICAFFMYKTAKNNAKNN